MLTIGTEAEKSALITTDPRKVIIIIFNESSISLILQWPPIVVFISLVYSEQVLHIFVKSMHLPSTLA